MALSYLLMKQSRGQLHQSPWSYVPCTTLQTCKRRDGIIVQSRASWNILVCTASGAAMAGDGGFGGKLELTLHYSSPLRAVRMTYLQHHSHTLPYRLLERSTKPRNPQPVEGGWWWWAMVFRRRRWMLNENGSQKCRRPTTILLFFRARRHVDPVSVGCFNPNLLIKKKLLGY